MKKELFILCFLTNDKKNDFCDCDIIGVYENENICKEDFSKVVLNVDIGVYQKQEYDTMCILNDGDGEEIIIWYEKKKINERY